MTKAWPRNTLCSAPDWASKARARASAQPVNTVNTARRWAAARAPHLPQDAAGQEPGGAGGAGTLPRSSGRLRGGLRFEWAVAEAL